MTCLEKILKELEDRTFSAELCGSGWNGEEVNNLLCLGDVAFVLEEYMDKENERTPVEETEKEFTKSDLEDSMVVSLRNGECCLVVKRGEELRMFTEWRFLDGKDILDNLKSRLFEGKTRHELDIMQVFAPAPLEKVTNILDLIEEKGELIWERREEMTLEEVEKELGYKIKIVESGEKK